MIAPDDQTVWRWLAGCVSFLFVTVWRKISTNEKQIAEVKATMGEIVATQKLILKIVDRRLNERDDNDNIGDDVCWLRSESHNRTK